MLLCAVVGSMKDSAPPPRPSVRALHPPSSLRVSAVFVCLFVRSVGVFFRACVRAGRS